MCISQNPVIFIGRIQGVFKLKGNNIEQPKIYLGDHVVNMIVDGAAGWYMSAEKYVRAAVKNVEQKIAKSNQRLPTGCKTPMYGYWPETDTFTDIKAEGVKKYK